MVRPRHGQARDLMQIAAAVVGSAAAAQVIAPRVQHVEIDYGNGEGEDWWAERVVDDGDTLTLHRGYGSNGEAFDRLIVRVVDADWTVTDVAQ